MRYALNAKPSDRGERAKKSSSHALLSALTSAPRGRPARKKGSYPQHFPAVERKRLVERHWEKCIA